MMVVEVVVEDHMAVVEEVEIVDSLNLIQGIVVVSVYVLLFCIVT